MKAKELLKENFFKKDTLKDIIGLDNSKSQIKSALLTGRHVVIVGPPGVGKTTIAKNISESLMDIQLMDCPLRCKSKNASCPQCSEGKSKMRMFKGPERFIRVQGSPDLTPEDLLGDIDPTLALKYGPTSVKAFTPGKIFRANMGILFFDEVNRCAEKLQNALLQALEERKVTIGSYELDLPANFIFIGTMNPEDTSTEKLSDVFSDRFDMIYMSYPEKLTDEVSVIKLKAKIHDSNVSEELILTAAAFVRALRNHEKLEKKPSVRASIGLVERASSNAYLKGEKEAKNADLKESAKSVLAHRIRLKPSVRHMRSPAEFINDEFERFERQRQKENREHEGYL